MSAQLTILGCRAGAPGEGAAASGYLLESAAGAALIDCGPGVVLSLSSRANLPQLDAAVISHRHADHCIDLLALAYMRRFPSPLPPLLLFGPPDLGAVLEGLDTLFGMPSLPSLASPLRDAFDFHPVAPGASFRAAGLVLETLAAHHPVPTLAMRWPELGLVYTSDGALTDELVAFAAGATVLLAEATYLRADERDLVGHGHLTARQAGELANRAGVHHLVLTHLANMADAEEARRLCKEEFHRPLTIATPGCTILLGTHDTPAWRQS